MEGRHREWHCSLCRWTPHSMWWAGSHPQYWVKSNSGAGGSEGSHSHKGQNNLRNSNEPEPWTKSEHNLQPRHLWTDFPPFYLQALQSFFSVWHHFCLPIYAPWNKSECQECLKYKHWSSHTTYLAGSELHEEDWLSIRQIHSTYLWLHHWVEEKYHLHVKLAFVASRVKTAVAVTSLIFLEKYLVCTFVEVAEWDGLNQNQWYHGAVLG